MGSLPPILVSGLFLQASIFPRFGGDRSVFEDTSSAQKFLSLIMRRYWECHHRRYFEFG